MPYLAFIVKRTVLPNTCSHPHVNGMWLHESTIIRRGSLCNLVREFRDISAIDKMRIDEAAMGKTGFPIAEPGTTSMSRFCDHTCDLVSEL